MKTLFHFLRLLCLFAAIPFLRAAEIRVGIIGTDTTHALTYTKLLNNPDAKDHVSGARVTAIYKSGSPDIPQSVERLEDFTQQLFAMPGITACDTIEQLAQTVDAIMILSVDGRAHLDQARRAIPLGKPIYITKPLAASLSDAQKIFALAAQHKTPLFSSSSLRFTLAQPALANANAATSKTRVGPIKGAFAWSPATLEPHNPGLFWYGIHAVETLYTAMGTGCRTVTTTHTEDTDIVTGIWTDGRTGTIRGTRNTKPVYGLTLFGANATHTETGGSGYAPLVKEIVTFFQTRVAPVTPAETLEIIAFIEAANLSQQRNGAPIPLPNSEPRTPNFELRTLNLEP